MIPSSVLPNAIARDVNIVPAVVRLTRKAPIMIAGMTLLPNKINAANAIPVGGHIGVALELRKASDRPNLPATM